MTDSRVTPPTGKPVAYVYPVRKDGKFKVVFAFTGKNITKVLTQPAVAALHPHYIVRLA